MTTVIIPKPRRNKITYNYRYAYPYNRQDLIDLCKSEYLNQILNLYDTNEQCRDNENLKLILETRDVWCIYEFNK